METVTNASKFTKEKLLR